MTGRTATKIGLAAALCRLITVTVVVELMLAMTSNADDDSSTSSDTDWGCASAADQYRHFGDVDGIPTSLIEGELLLSASLE